MRLSPWPPAIVLAIGAFLATVGVRAQYSLPLRAPLAASVPTSIDGFRGRDVSISPEEEKVVAVTNYLSRIFERPDTAAAGPAWFQLYVGYYDRQTSGKAIHSPKNCLPGGGWEPLTSSTMTVQTASGPVTVNRYLIQKGRQQALVLYWYQGRGRVASNEYGVKWDLVRDAAVRRRSEEALVRIVIPLRGGEERAAQLATTAAQALVPAIYTALPT